MRETHLGTVHAKKLCNNGNHVHDGCCCCFYDKSSAKSCDANLLETIKF